MRLEVDAAARSAFFRAITLCICLGCSAAVVLALINISILMVGLRPDGILTFQILTVLYLAIGGVLAISSFQLWGSSSCLGDFAIWLTALLALVGSFLIQRVICAVLIPTQFVARAPRMSLVCDPSYQRTVAYGSALTVVIITLVIWGMVRYLGWRARNAG